MNDMERRKFEQSFQDAFKDAEVQPSDKVWTNVELDLIKAEGEKMKRRILFYQILAAASISFAVIFAGVGFYALNENKAQQIALNKINEKATGTIANGNNKESISEHAANINGSKSAERNAVSPEISQPAPDLQNEVKEQENTIKDQKPNKQSLDHSGSSSSELVAESNDRSRQQNEVPSSATANDINKDKAISSETEVASTDIKSADEVNRNTLYDQSNAITNMKNNVAAADSRGGSETKLPALFKAEVPQLVFAPREKVEADPVALMFARLNDLERELAKESTKKSKSSSERLWTSVGFAAGAFNSITSAPSGPSSGLSTGPTFTMTNNTAVQNQTKASGVAYSMGITMGAQVADRWVVQGGVNYLTEMSDYTSTQAVQESGTFKAASVNQFRSSSSMDATEKFIPTAPYTVNNSNEYVSIPLQAGYLIIKRKMQWQLNAGVSTDLFIQNTIDPEGNIEKTTSGAGDESPFRTVNFSGLIGSEVSYRFGDHYRLGINPGLRYPLNSIYKDNLGLESTPLTFDIGLRFRYIFK
jgi:hypothetical protein